MTAQEWTVIIGVLTSSVLTIWTAFTVWSDRRRKSEQEQERLKWEQTRQAEEAAHRRKMEELQMVAIRQGGAAAKAAKQAQEAAVVSGKAVTLKIDESIKERREQVAVISEKIDENTKVNEEAINTANGFNGKLVKLGEAVAARAIET